MNDRIKKLASNASSNASVSAASVLRTTLFNFTDFHDIGAYLLSTPYKNIIYPP